MTITGARAELATALTTAGVRVSRSPAGLEPPAVVLYGGGVDPSHIARGQVRATVRVTCLAGAWDGEGAADMLAELVETVLGVLLALADWQVGETRADTVINVAGSQLLGADVFASRMVDL